MKNAADAPSKARYHHGDLRHALVEAAVDLVARHGVEAFSLREAAREVGVSPAAAYRHFEDKAALMGAVAADGMWRLSAGMEKALARAPGPPGSPAHAAASLLAVGEAYVEFAVRNPSHFNVMFGPWCPHVDPAVTLPAGPTPTGRDPYQILVDTLDGLVTAGAIGAAARAGAEVTAWTGVHGLASLLVEGALPLGPAERAQAVALLGRTILTGLGCPPGLVGAPAAAGPALHALAAKARKGAKQR
jgi:AcrR family transcriptional regulator